MTNIDPKKLEWYNKYYKILLAIPVIILILCLGYIVSFYMKTGDIMYRDSSLSGGTTVTLTGDINADSLESALKAEIPDVNFRHLTDLQTGELKAVIIDTSEKPDVIKTQIEKILGYELTDKNSSIEFTGPSLSQSFYQQLIFALVIAFVLMSVVVFFSFKTFVPSLAVIFAALGDIVMPLTVINLLGIKLSAAGISAFLMLIGYSVDTDILLTSRALRKQGGNLNQRIYGAFKTGSFMTITALAAVLPAFFFISNLPDSFRQIFLILALGLFADLINTWLTNASILKWYCDHKKIE